ncbi:MAG: hypothetical protein AAFQ41_07955, partial [Cyanobacteria bacterium J06623_7]
SNKLSPAPTTIPELAEIAPPAVPESDRPRVTTPKLREPLASTERLPSPPAVEAPKPKPDIPDPADYSLADVGQRAGLKQPQSPEQERETITQIVPTTPDRAETEATIAHSGSGKSDVSSTISSSKELTANDSNAGADRVAESNDIAPDLAANNSVIQPSQIQQITTYFEQRWQPPADLNQSLEYRLIMQADGSIKRVIPLGRGARLYLTQTGMPLDGEPLIAATSSEESSVIRLLLNPDGGVQAFIE